MADPLTNCEVLLGVCGGVAAYKSADLCSRLVQRGARVSVILTDSATQFIGRSTFEALTQRPVHDDQFTPREHWQGEHIGLAKRAQMAVVAPATARSIARFALGLSDDLLSTTLLVCRCPILVAPAMNANMWDAPAVQRNVAQLRADGVQIVGPGEGWLSCGQIGAGRMAEPSEILAAILRALPNHSATQHS
jgi:phosphopantothenoylcysteine decarboxylase/phosphopantothenate--cysteine ligase